jgi:hypothetical protein
LLPAQNQLMANFRSGYDISLSVIVTPELFTCVT